MQGLCFTCAAPKGVERPEQDKGPLEESGAGAPSLPREAAQRRQGGSPHTGLPWGLQTQLPLHPQVSSVLPSPGNVRIMNLLWEMRRDSRQKYF